MKDRIAASLAGIERDHAVRILYACESGSRAWGFASPDSDYDVRFLYARPASAYLRLDMPRDVIELPIEGDLDVSGWDIFKALRLLRKSNPSLLEWFFSPVIYRETRPVVARLRAIARSWFSTPALFYHYRHMAGGDYRQYIQGKTEVRRKKYLYVVRPLAALLFLEEHHAIPPTSFLETLNQITIDAEIRTRIDELVHLKMAGDELSMGAPDVQLNAWIEGLFARLADAPQEPASSGAMTAPLERVLADILHEQPEEMCGLSTR